MVATCKTASAQLSNGYWTPDFNWSIHEGNGVFWSREIPTDQSWCSLLGGNRPDALVVGDSTQLAFFHLLCPDKHERHDPHKRDDPLLRAIPSYVRSSCMICNGSRMHYIRNDWLDVRTSGYGPASWRIPGAEWCSPSSTGNISFFGTAHCAAWAHHRLLQRTGLLFLQTGLHTTPWPHRVTKVTEAASLLQPFISDGLAVVFRTSVPGWANCSRLAASHPLPFSSISEAEMNLIENPWYNAYDIMWQQRILRELVSSYGWIVLDVHQMTVLRPDVHHCSPASDCLHLCPAHDLGWKELLGNVMRYCTPDTDR